MFFIIIEYWTVDVVVWNAGISDRCCCLEYRTVVFVVVWRIGISYYCCCLEYRNIGLLLLFGVLEYRTVVLVACSIGISGCCCFGVSEYQTVVVFVVVWSIGLLLFRISEYRTVVVVWSIGISDCNCCCCLKKK